VVLAYMRAVMEDRPDEACRLAARPLVYTLHCETRPRIPHDTYVAAGSRPRIEHIDLKGDQGFAWVVGINPGPVQSVSLARLGASWKVVEHGGAFGLA
jgi:hypothetical protein